jgi:hypothetical protein
MSLQISVLYLKDGIFDHLSPESGMHLHKQLSVLKKLPWRIFESWMP